MNTDKVDTEVPSPATGILLEILVEEGMTIQAGTVLATIGPVGETPDAGEPAYSLRAAQTSSSHPVPIPAGDSLTLNDLQMLPDNHSRVRGAGNWALFPRWWHAWPKSMPST